MIKKLILTIFALVFIYISVELFRYFSYWGLGFSAILLATIFCSVVIVSILSWILRNRKKIFITLRWLVDLITKTRLYQKIRRQFQTRWPRLYNLLKKRLDKNSPIGLYVTIGGIVAGIFFLLFVGVGFDLIFKQPLYLADTRTIHLLRAFISSSYIPLFILITSFANTNTILVTTVISAIILLLCQKYRAIQYLIISASSGFVFYWLIKWVAHRLRPQGISYIALPQSFSFPSGHAVMAVCLYGFIAFLLFKNFKGATKKAIIIVAFLLLSIAVGVSRVYLGVHYPSDVIAGWYLGLTILASSIATYEIRNKFYPVKKSIQKTISLSSIVIAVLIVIPFITIYQNYHHTTTIQPKGQVVATTIQDFLKDTAKYSEDLLGETMEPISFIIIGNQQEIITLFNKAGWHQAVQPNLPNVLKELSAIAKNINYPTGPMTPAFYNEQTNDLVF